MNRSGYVCRGPSADPRRLRAEESKILLFQLPGQQESQLAVTAVGSTSGCSKMGFARKPGGDGAPV